MHTSNPFQGLLKQQKEEQEEAPIEQKPEEQLLDLNCESEHLNGTDDLPAAELSPNLRRSTRASALKAQEKIRLKDGVPTTMVDSHVVSDFWNLNAILPVLGRERGRRGAERALSTDQSRRHRPTDGSADQEEAKTVGLREVGSVRLQIWNPFGPGRRSGTEILQK
jgi:hypothetical protein